MVYEVPSLNEKSEKSPLSPLMLTTPYASTLTFFPSVEASLAISGNESPLPPFYKDFYKIIILINNSQKRREEIII